jgi:hypothetical protein
MSDANDEAIRELEEASRRLVDAIKRYMNGLGAVGVVIPTPPRPKMDAIGKLNFGATLVLDAVDVLRR